METLATPELKLPTVLLPRVASAMPRLVRNKEIMLRALDGQSAGVIAEATGLAEGTIRGILNSDLVKAEMQRLQGEMGKDLVQKVKARSHFALETVTDVMNGELVSELRFKAASKVLDLNPELKPQKDDVAGALGAGLGEYLIRELAKRGREREVTAYATGTGNEGEGEAATLVPRELVGDGDGD